jgi:ubiquinone/menaquinone biosynthesis C-methylase UbiE
MLNTGYKIFERAKISGDILEIGLGFILHLEFRDYPKIHKYTLFDSTDKNLKVSRNVLNDHKVHNDRVLYNKDLKLKCFIDNQIDYIISFFTLEHIPDI